MEQSLSGVREFAAAIREFIYIRTVRFSSLHHRRLILAALLAGLALRLFFVLRHPLITFDASVYGDIAKNWLLSGTFGMTENGVAAPTLIRLPGYPAFLAMVWLLSGIEHYRAVELTQVVIDLGGCFVIAGIARQLLNQRAALIAFVMAALCPFLANYVAIPQTETLAIFFSGAALYSAQRALREARWAKWIAGCGSSVAAAILMRPDGVILLAAIGSYLLWHGLGPRRGRKQAFDKFAAGATGNVGRTLTAGLLLGACALLPLVPSTVRNWNVFHQFQPLAPRYANAPGEFVPHGFHRWVKTWIVDYVSTEELFWKISADVPGEMVDAGKLPDRAFDDPGQRAETSRLFDEYNLNQVITPQIDSEFALLAGKRVEHAPLGYYLWLPALRVADMWMRPRTEMLPIESRWWEYENHEGESQIAITMLLLNAALLFTALAAPIAARKMSREASIAGAAHTGLQNPGLLFMFIFLRSVLLASLENPEQRYTLECFPAVIALSAATLACLPPIWKRFVPAKAARIQDQQAA